MDGAGKILIVDEDPYVRDTLVNILEGAGYGTFESECFVDAVRHLRTEFIDLVLVNIRLPDKSGFDLLDHVKKKHSGVDTILLSAFSDVDSAAQAIGKGAYDYISKPFHAFDILMAVNRAQEKRRLIIQNKDFLDNLEKKVREQALSLRLRGEEKLQLLNNMILSFVTTLEAKDKYTEGHSRRVAETALVLADRVGMSPREQEEIRLAGIFHDMGKIGIREGVLNKKGKLNAEEYEVIKQHVMIGVKILSQIPQFKAITPVVRSHHEFFDGNGYPDGIVGEKIPLGGRILAVCDAFDAMTSGRPYRNKLTTLQAAGILHRNRGTQFDPQMVDIFLRSFGYEKAS